MTKSLAKIEAQIAKLQQEANAIRARDIEGVIGRIREAIKHYSLTPADLFGKSSEKAAKGPTAKKRSGKKTSTAIKYRDDSGNSWTGKGRQPNWFKAAVAAGKKPEDLLVK